MKSKIEAKFLNIDHNAIRKELKKWAAYAIVVKAALAATAILVNR